MQKIIKNGQIIENDYLWIQAETDAIGPNCILPLDLWPTHTNAKGIWLDSHQGLDLIANIDIHRLDVIGLHFPAFTDGRAFSYARLLRERFKFKGEIRALGNFIPDQLGYMLRVGFNAFQFNDSVDLEKALLLHKPFSITYQGDVNDPRPIFLRRTV
jgi:uncharacterized protein (DUF934 family)